VSEEKKTPEEWAAEDGLTVMDPDGWRFAMEYDNPPRSYMPQDWRMPITRQEWEDRLSVSSIIRKTKDPTFEEEETAARIAREEDVSYAEAIQQVTASPRSPQPEGSWKDVRGAIDNLKNLGLGEVIDNTLNALHRTVDKVDKTTAVQKWADVAMYASETLDARQGPRVHLLNAPNDPLGAIAAMALMYKGVVVRDLANVTDQQRREMFAQIQQTKLKAPFEAVQLHWMVEGVTRSFTHQMVRQRTAVFAQESLRFAVVEDGFAERVALPPHLAGTVPLVEWAREMTEEDGSPKSREYMERNTSELQNLRNEWDSEVDRTGRVYQNMVDAGMPAEDARGLLPHNITTRLNYVTNLRNFLEHGGNRLCTQAQFEWRAVWIAFVQELRRYGHGVFYYSNEYEPESTKCNSSWQFDLIADMFRPACYLTGKCEFAAQDLDRKCKIRDRVDAFQKEGVPSASWDRPQDWTREQYQILDPIRPREWLADPGAAR